MLERLWRMKEAIIVFSIAGMAVLLAPTALWVRAVGFAAATLVYWRYVWKYKGVKEETAEALERERERQRWKDERRVSERSDLDSATVVASAACLTCRHSTWRSGWSSSTWCSRSSARRSTSRISTAVGLRARFLQVGILNLLSAAPETTEAGKETARSFYGHPLVQGLIRTGRGPDPRSTRGRRPSGGGSLRTPRTCLHGRSSPR